MSQRKHLEIFSDGACSGNPGPGGWGAVLRYQGIETCDVTLTTDSKYAADGITKGWAASWKRNGWKKADKKPALNSDLWEKILELTTTHSVEIVWVKGHAGHPENERCDTLATTAIAKFKR